MTYEVTPDDLQRLGVGYEAWNRGDVGWLVKQLDPEFELHDLDVPDSPVYHGPKGFLDNLKRLKDFADGLAFTPLEVVPVGDKVLIVTRVKIRGRASGVELEQDIAHVWTMRDGKPLRLDVHLDPQRAREAVGLGPGA